MAKSLRLPILILVACALATVALGQSADKNTGGPTANTLQLRLLEPAEGATITGTQVRVGISYNMNAFGQGTGTKFGEANFPQPTFDIFLGNDLRTTLKGTEANVAFIENVPPGAHKLVVMAKNVSGEVIDRKEVNITTVPAAAEFVERAPAPPPAAPPPPPAPMIEAPAPPPPPPAPVIEPEPELPKTGSAYPAVAGSGLLLILVGLALGRKRVR